MSLVQLTLAFENKVMIKPKIKKSAPLAKREHFKRRPTHPEHLEWKRELNRIVETIQGQLGQISTDPEHEDIRLVNVFVPKSKVFDLIHAVNQMPLFSESLKHSGTGPRLIGDPKISL